MNVRIAVIGAAAALLLALAVGTASGRRLRVSNQRFRITWASFTVSEATPAEEGVSIECPLTLEGSLHAATLAKTRETLVGYVTRAAVGTCASGAATVLTDRLPWHVLYESFRGTLPSITGMRLAIAGLAYQAEPGIGIRCLGRTDTISPLAIDLARQPSGALISARVDETIGVFLFGGPDWCPLLGSFSGTGEFYVLGSTTRITLSLI